MERYRLVSRSTRTARRRFVPFVVFFLLAALLTQANVSAAGSAAPTPPAPPSEKLLAEYGRWETEYWPDTGGLSFNYVGDPIPTAPPADKQNGNPDFVISAPTLLTAIIDVHVNPNTDAAQGTQAAPPGSLALVDAVGNYYGPFAAEAGAVAGKPGAIGLWVVLVDHIELPPGHYWVHDSDPSSLLGNVQTFNVGATLVKGVDAAAYARYMDALIAVNESEPDKEGATPTPVANTAGTQPEKITYSHPQSVVNSPPDPAVTAYPANNPSFPCGFVTDKPVMVTKIMDYHINNGKGAAPGLIGLQEHGGTWYGSWPAYGQAYNSIPNAIWVVTPNFEIPAGSYKVMDNEFSTLSAGADNKAMCVVNVAPVVTSPIDNVTGKYTIDFMGDDGTSADFPLVLAVIDHKNSLEVGAIVVDMPFKFSAAVTGRNLGVVTARFSQGFSGINLVVQMTFTKKADGYRLTGRVIALNNDNSGGVGFSGARTSTDLPGFVPQPAGGIGKVGRIPGPGSAGQAAAGIAFPTLATLIAGAAAALGSGGYGGGYGGDSGDDGGGDSGGDDGGGDSGGDDGGADSGGDDGGADSGGDDGGGGDTSGYDSSGAGGADGGGGSGSGVDVAGGGSAGVTGAAAGGSTDAGPVAVSALAPQAGPQDGQTMSVHDYGDGSDKTYVYHADTGGWINPLTGGAYVAANYATSAQDHIDTTNADNEKAKADAYALAEGPNKRLAQIAEDGRTRLRLLAEIQKTQRAIYDTPGAEGEGPVSSSDRMNKLAEGLTSGQVSIADAQALLNRQKQFNGDIHVGKAGTQSAADLAASQDTAGAAIAHMGNDAVQGAYNAATDVQGKTWSGQAVRLTAGYLTGGASEVLIYIPANIAITTNGYMDAGDSATRAFAKAFVGEGLTQAAQFAALYSGGAALKGAASALGIKPSLTLPASWGKTLNTDVRELLPGAAGKTARAVSGVEAKAVEDIAVHNAEFGATNRDITGKLNKLNEDALNGPLAPDQIKPTLADREARRALEAGGTPELKQSFNDVVDTQINKPSLDYTKQALTEKYGTLTDPAHPGYQYKKMLDDGYTVEATNFRTPKPGENLSVNADNDVAGFMVKRDMDGNIIHQHDLPATDVMAAHSEGFSKNCQVYNAETRTFNATKASSELGIDFNDPKALTNGMNRSDLAKFGVNEDLSNLTPDRLRQLQLDKYARAYGNEVPGTSGKDFARDYSTSDTVMKFTPTGELKALPQSSYEAMQASGGKGGLLDPQGFALMERNKVISNWNDGSVRSQMEAMESLRKMGVAANKVTAGYSGLGMKPVPGKMQYALDHIIPDRSISPAVRAQKMVRLGVGDPLTFSNKLSGFIEGAKMATGKK